jgi:hypothetical protein
MGRRKINGSIITVLVVIVALWLMITYINSSVEYYYVFEHQRELFDAYRDRDIFIDTILPNFD